MKLARSKKRVGALDLTPMLDVVFLLLIFFMVSTRFERLREVPIELPKAAQAEQPASNPKTRVQMRSDGALWVNGEPVQENALAARLMGEPRIVISADERVAHGDFMRVLTHLRALPLTSVTVEVEAD